MPWFKNLRVGSKLLLSFALVILLASGAGVFIIVGMNGVNSSYEHVMEITGQRIEYIFAAEDCFARARIIVSEAHYPENSADDLARLSAELDLALDELKGALEGLCTVASPTVQEKALDILPMVDKYRVDSARAINILLSAGEVSLENGRYREALLVSEQATADMASMYADELYADIENLSSLSIGALRSLTAENSARAELVLSVSLVFFAVVATVSFAIALWVPSQISKAAGSEDIFARAGLDCPLNMMIE